MAQKYEVMKEYVSKLETANEDLRDNLRKVRSERDSLVIENGALEADVTKLKRLVEKMYRENPTELFTQWVNEYNLSFEV